MKSSYLLRSYLCDLKLCSFSPVHRGAFCQFPFRWIYYCHSSKSTGKESGKTHLCAVHTKQVSHWPKHISELKQIPEWSRFQNQNDSKSKQLQKCNMIQKHHRFQNETDFRIKQIPEYHRFKDVKHSKIKLFQNCSDSNSWYKSTRFLKIL